MWFGKKKVPLVESGIFKGFIDWHSHILPGIDDGIQSIEEALEVLKEYERLGFKKVWLTPHVMEDYPNETGFLRNQFSELKRIWSGNMEIALASENMLDNLFEERLQNNDFLPIGDDGDHLLVETSYYSPPYGMYEMFEETKKKGYNVILAHPERYRYMDEKDYIRLKDRGILFQLNILSLTGAYGEEAKKKAEWLVKHNLKDFFGTDVHRIETFTKWKNERIIKVL